jgi:3-oxoacyl-[acyl-carrier protein] reductase
VLILSHSHPIDSNIQSTTLENFAMHFSVNARATWLLAPDFCNLFAGDFKTGQIIVITIDRIAGKLP